MSLLDRDYDSNLEALGTFTRIISSFEKQSSYSLPQFLYLPEHLYAGHRTCYWGNILKIIK